MKRLWRFLFDYHAKFNPNLLEFEVYLVIFVRACLSGCTRRSVSAIPERIHDAVRAVQGRTTYRDAAKLYFIPMYTLCDNLNAASRAPSPSTPLSASEESKLVKLLLSYAHL